MTRRTQTPAESCEMSAAISPTHLSLPLLCRSNFIFGSLITYSTFAEIYCEYAQ